MPTTVAFFCCPTTLKQAIVSGFRESPDDNFDPVLAEGLHVGDVLLSVNGLHVLGNFNQV